MSLAQVFCRCGAAENTDPHPCHGNGYSCRKPAARRFYNPEPVALSGVHMKLQVSETWACDECWPKHEERLFAARRAANMKAGASS